MDFKCVFSILQKIRCTTVYIVYSLCGEFEFYFYTFLRTLCSSQCGFYCFFFDTETNVRHTLSHTRIQIHSSHFMGDSICEFLPLFSFSQSHHILFDVSCDASKSSVVCGIQFRALGKWIFVCVDRYALLKTNV